MIDTNVNKRIESFTRISQLILTDIFEHISFTIEEKNIYGSFAEALSNHLSKFTKAEPIFEYNPDVIISNLEKLITENVLEKNIQNNSKLIECFLKGSYRYSTIKNIEVSCVISFCKFLKYKPNHMQKIVVNNIIERLKTIPIEFGDELPF